MNNQIESDPKFAQIADIRLKKLGMIAYLKLKVDQEDWHAVQDAGSDIREMDAMIKVLSS